MSFTNAQIAQLDGNLDTKHVRERKQGTFRLSYIEGWHAIAEANRIFGFDGWNSETVLLQAVNEKPGKIGADRRDGWMVSYIAKCRVTVGGVTREGTGAGHGIDTDLGKAHESAIKEAETDARKRALMTFGNKFGLALYDKEKANVAHGADDADNAAAVAAESQPADGSAEEAAARAEAEAKEANAWREREKAKAKAAQAGKQWNGKQPQHAVDVEDMMPALPEHVPDQEEQHDPETGELPDAPVPVNADGSNSRKIELLALLNRMPKPGTANFDSDRAYYKEKRGAHWPMMTEDDKAFVMGVERSIAEVSKAKQREAAKARAIDAKNGKPVRNGWRSGGKRAA
jgi:DNA recombination protein Rad52